MDKLKIAVLQSGYSIQYGNDVISQRLDGGASRFEVDVKRQNHIGTVSWALPQAKYQSFMAFYRKSMRNPSQPFLCDLIIDDHQVKEYQCQFVPGSVQLTSKNAKICMVSAQLEVKANIPDEAFDDSLIDLLDSDLRSEDLDRLEDLADVDLPAALENVSDALEDMPGA